MKTNFFRVDMMHGSMVKNLMFFSLPLIATSIMQVLYNAADMMTVGQFCGKNALAAVGATTNPYNLIVNIIVGLGAGVGVVVAQEFGGDKREEMSDTVHTSAALSVIIGVLFAVIGIIITPAMLSLLDTPSEIIDDAVLYLRILFLGVPALVIYNFGAAILRSIGDNRSPFVFLGISTVLNLVLNLLFVLVFKMGIAGVAIATVISQCVPAVLVWLGLIRTHEYYYYSFKQTRLIGSSAAAVLKIGVPTGLQAALFTVANLVMQSQFNKLGTDYIAANSACSSIENIIYTALTAMSQAILVFAGQNVGAGLIVRLKKLFWVGGGMSVTVGLVAGIFVVVFRIPLLHIFTTDTGVIPLAESRLVLVSLTVFVHGLYESSLSLVRGMGYSLAPMIGAIFGICIFRIVWVYFVFPLCPTYLMLVAIWPISQLVTGIVESILFFHYFKKVKQKAAQKTAEA